MIDIEKERESFEIANSNSLKDSAWHEIWFEDNWYSCDEGALIRVQTFCSDINRDFGLWIQCAEYKQHEIDDLKAQLEAIKSEKCVWRENEDGMWNTACGQDYIFDSYAIKTPSDIGQYCSNCGKKIKDVSYEESEDE